MAGVIAMLVIKVEIARRLKTKCNAVVGCWMFVLESYLVSEALNKWSEYGGSGWLSLFYRAKLTDHVSHHETITREKDRRCRCYIPASR